MFQPTEPFPCSFLVVFVIYSTLGCVCLPPCTSSPSATVDGFVAGPSQFPLHVSQKCLGFQLRLWPVSATVIQWARLSQLHSAPEWLPCCAGLGVLVISSLTVFPLSIPLRSCLSLGHSRRYTDPWFSSVSSHSLSLSGCSAAGHSLDCLMFPCTLLYFSTEQRHLLLLHVRGLITHRDDQGTVEFFRIVFWSTDALHHTYLSSAVLRHVVFTQQGVGVIDQRVRRFSQRGALVSECVWRVCL